MTEQYLPTEYQNIIHLSRYARWLDDEERRETWDETVTRYFDFFEKYLLDNYNYEFKERKQLEKAVLKLEAMPSMRALMTAGLALERDHVAGYNCAYVAISRQRSFDEIMYILMCGTGVGFSVERQFVNNLPEVSEKLYQTDTTIMVADSKIGWAKAYKELISLLYSGQIPKWDLSKLRPAGARLKTFGGRSSGPAPLENLFKFTVNTFMKATGRKLNSIECHDLVCKIAEIVVVGGVRRSALISLSNLTDERLRTAKSGQWWEINPQRSLANNSVAYTEKPDMGIFMHEWNSLYKSKSGERGIFNREAVKKHLTELVDRRDSSYEFGVNPCGEIILRDRQFCNLSEIVVRPDDTEKTLKAKVKVATILGTLQSLLTDFRYISNEWSKNCQEERLLGVSLTGIMDHEMLNGIGDVDKIDEYVAMLKKVAIDTNKEWAKKLGINPATAITCIKPSGTVSQLVNASSGIHPRHAEYYVRTIRGDKKDPVSKFMFDKGFPCEDEIHQPDHMWVFSFPQKAPSNGRLRKDLSATDQLKLWKKYSKSWCEHNPSVTINVKEDEWMGVGSWVYENFNDLNGVSFLPYAEHSYLQAPYQECTKEQYEELLAKMPQDVDWNDLSQYEQEDNTTGSQTLACSGGSCEITDIGEISG